MTLATLSAMAFLHIFIAFVVLDIYSVFPFLAYFDRYINKGTLTVALVPLYLLFWLLIRRKKLEAMHDRYVNDWDLIYKWRVILVTYSIILVLAAAILTIYTSHYQHK